VPKKDEIILRCILNFGLLHKCTVDVHEQIAL